MELRHIYNKSFHIFEPLHECDMSKKLFCLSLVCVSKTALFDAGLESVEKWQKV
jgi:hypothetical protein